MSAYYSKLVHKVVNLEELPILWLSDDFLFVSSGKKDEYQQSEKMYNRANTHDEQNSFSKIPKNCRPSEDEQLVIETRVKSTLVFWYLG